MFLGPRKDASRASVLSIECLNPLANAGDAGDGILIPGSGRFLREGNGNPLQCSCLDNSKDRGAWQATVHWVAKELGTS